MIDFKIHGIKIIQQNLKKVNAEMRQAVAASLYEKALKIENLSVKMVPVVTGTLKRSHFVKKPKAGDEKPKAQIGYNTKYAAKVHEISRRGWKYLERPFNSETMDLIPWLRRRIAENLKSGVRFK